MKMHRFNSELEAVEENSVSLTGRQASFRGTGCTTESVSIFQDNMATHDCCSRR
jgi:hypothetical protein